LTFYFRDERQTKIKAASALSQWFSPGNPTTPSTKDKLWTPGYFTLQEESFKEQDGQVKLDVLNYAIERLSEGVEGMADITTEPVEFQLKTTLDKASLEERKICKEKAKNACRLVCATIAPKDGDTLLKSIQEPEQKISEEIFSLLMAHSKAPTKNIQIQILSLYAHQFSVEKLKELHSPFEKVSSRQIKAAREHAKKLGSGMPLQKTVLHRVRIDKQKLDHFLSFIDRPYFYQDVAFGTRTVKLDSGEKLTMPNVVRTVTRATMIAQYMEHCQNTDFVPLSRSSLYRVLAVRQASQRKSLQGK